MNYLPYKNAVNFNKIHAISLIALLFQNSPATSKTIYSIPFDHHTYQSSDSHFRELSEAQIIELCKIGSHASTTDTEECEHRNFEAAERILARSLTNMIRRIKKTDIELKVSHDPVALPSFVKAQNEWTRYRDNYCYSRTYSIGEASMRYIFFWTCMNDMTTERAKQLDAFFDY